VTPIQAVRNLGPATARLAGVAPFTGQDQKKTTPVSTPEEGESFLPLERRRCAGLVALAISVSSFRLVGLPALSERTCVLLVPAEPGDQGGRPLTSANGDFDLAQ
jgi:hypothetical protein